MEKVKFIEVTVAKEIILHGFDNNNQEIRNETNITPPKKKLINVSNIISVDEDFIQTLLPHNRIALLNYLEPYERLTGQISEYNKIRPY